MIAQPTPSQPSRRGTSPATMRLFLGLGSLALVPVGLVGCRPVGPDALPPKPAAPATWEASATGVAAQPLAPAALDAWWTALGDPVLTDLVQRTLAGNLDLKGALARIEEAQANRDLTDRNRRPQAGAGASATRSQTSRSALSNLDATPQTRSLADHLAEPTTRYGLGVSTSWELDLFGRVRRQVESAEAGIRMREEDRRDLQVSLAAEVALAYLDLRQAQAQLQLAQETVETETRRLKLVEANWSGGEGTRLEVEMAQAGLDAARTALPTLASLIRQDQHHLERLAGLGPGALAQVLATAQPLPKPPVSLAIGIPADVLRQRPDVRRAEAQLAGATADIGVAAADKYPRLSWNGSLGLETVQGGSLFSAASRVFSLGPSLSWNLFDAGRVTQHVRVQTARQQQARTAFDATVLKACHEVEDAVTRYGQEQLRRAGLVEAERAAQRALEVAEHQFQGGERDLLGVLDLRRTWQNAQGLRIQSDATVTAEAVRIYRSLGGGWTPR